MLLSAKLYSSGNTAVFDVSAAELEARAYPGQNLNGRVIQIGRHVATKKNGIWMRSERIDGNLFTARVTDRREIEMLDACPSCDDFSILNQGRFQGIESNIAPGCTASHDDGPSP